MKLIIVFLMLMISTICQARQIRVGVIDTGLDITDPRFASILCKEPQRDFTGDGIRDTEGHGTHVVGLIKKYAQDSDYCIIIYKYRSKRHNGVYDAYIAAVKQVMVDHLDIVNISSEGYEPLIDEVNMIKNNPNTLFIVSAGNDNQELNYNKKCQVFPACIPFNNVIPVGNILEDGITLDSDSNYGDVVKARQAGDGVCSTIPLNFKAVDGITICGEGMGELSGTSMSSAIHTGKKIYEISH